MSPPESQAQAHEHLVTKNLWAIIHVTNNDAAFLLAINDLNFDDTLFYAITHARINSLLL